MTDDDLSCNFCKRPKTKVGRLISAGDGNQICDMCVKLCSTTLEKHQKEKEKENKGHITIQVSAPEHSGKTSLVALLYHHLTALGAVVKLQRADPQLDEKLEIDDETLAERLTNVRVDIMEMQTYKKLS